MVSSNAPNSSGLQLPSVVEAEENKSQKFIETTMFGEPGLGFTEKVKQLFERVKMNELEKGMLEHHLK